MLKLKLIQWTTACLFLAMPFSQQAQGIEFEQSSWAEVKAKAKAVNKPIFVDCYTAWCGPCKWMAKEIFTQEAIGNYFKENFIAYKLDMQKGEGPEFAKTYQVAAFPTLLYFSADGEMMHKAVGARDSAQFMALCQDAIHPEKQLSAYQKRYENGDRDKAFVKEYLHVLANAGEKGRAIFDNYWATLSEKEKISADGLALMTQASSGFYDYKDPITAYFIDNKAAFDLVAGEAATYAFYDLQYCAQEKAIAEKDTKKRSQIIKEISAFMNPSEAALHAKVDFLQMHRQYYKEQKHLTAPEYFTALKAFMKLSTDKNELNLWAWNIYEWYDDKKVLKEAFKWATRSVKIEANYANTDTQAAILYKLGKYKKSKQLLQKAIALGENEGYNKEGMQGSYELLEKIAVLL